MSGWTYSFENVEKKSKMQKGKKGALLTVGWIREMGMTKLGAAELVVTSVWPLAASEARFGDVPDETLFTFSFCCQCLHAVFALFTLKHDHNKALGAQREAAVHRQHRLQVQQSCDSASGPLVFPQLCEKDEEVVAAERADNGYI